MKKDSSLNFIKVIIVLIVVVCFVLIGVIGYLATRQEVEQESEQIGLFPPEKLIRTIDFVQVCNERKNEFFNFCDGYQIAGHNNPITYKDITGDGLEEAIIPIGSGGSAGNIGLGIFQYKNGKLEELLFSADNDFKIENNQLITIKQALLSVDNNQRTNIQFTYYSYN